MKIKQLVFILFALFLSCSHPVEDKYIELYKANNTDGNSDNELDVNTEAQGTLSLSFTLPSTPEHRGVYIWIEDADGTYIDTIEQYDMTINNGSGIRFANDYCYHWKNAVGEGTREKVLDGISSASLYNSITSYESETWDCLDSTGAAISSGEYTIQVAITYDSSGDNRNPSRCTGTITIGSEDSTSNLTYDTSDTGGNRVTSVIASFTASAE